MSHTFTLVGTSNVLTTTYYPPIDLDPRYEYALGLIGLHTYNTIPNIYEGQNKFYYGDKVLTIPTGAYEVTDIETFLQDSLSKPTSSLKERNSIISVKPNNSTLKCEISSKFSIDFSKDDSIGHMLGFSKRTLEANKKHESDIPVQIIKVVTIRIECNITTAARIDNITLELVDQDGDPVNFRGEKIVVRLELKKIGLVFKHKNNSLTTRTISSLQPSNQLTPVNVAFLQSLGFHVKNGKVGNIRRIKV